MSGPSEVESVDGASVELHEAISRGDLHRQLPTASRASVFLLAGAILLGLGAVLTVVVAALESTVDASDRPMGVWFHDLATAHLSLRDFGMDFQLLGGSKVAAPLAALTVIVLVVTRHRRWALWFATVSVGGLLISQVLKLSVARERPTWPKPFEIESEYSFPSGHTLSGVTTWVALGVVLLFLLPRPWSTFTGWVCIVIGVLMAPSRLLLGVHWVTDVLGGWVFGFGWLLLVSGLFIRRLPATGPTAEDIDEQGSPPVRTP